MGEPSSRHCPDVSTREWKGHAIADVLLGHINPGQVADNFSAGAGGFAGPRPKRRTDICSYKEGILVGYRWFDAKRIEPLFPFGHGLSYTKFDLASLEVKRTATGVSVSLSISNGREGGSRGSSNICRTGFVHERPVRELRVLPRTFGPSESQRISVHLKSAPSRIGAYQRGLDGRAG